MNIFDIYREELHKAVERHPHDYPRWSAVTIDAVADKMIEAMKRGTYNKDGHAFRALCRRLGIPHTYRAINGAVTEAQR